MMSCFAAKISMEKIVLPNWSFLLISGLMRLDGQIGDSAPILPPGRNEPTHSSVLPAKKREEYVLILAYLGLNNLIANSVPN